MSAHERIAAHFGLGLALLAAAPLAAQQAPPWHVDRAVLDAEIERLESTNRHGIRLGLWVGDDQGQAALERRAEEAFPAASAIKTALLVELFGRRARELDRAPRELAALGSDEAHAMWAPFDAARRAEARAALHELSLFSLGDVAIRGTAVSNASYNAAGSALLALLGGPEAATRALAQRSPRYAGIRFERYFLAERGASENTATPRSLAALLADLASGAVPGLDAQAAESARAVLLSRRDPEHGALFAKDGALDSAPACRVRSGFCVDRFGTWVWVVMGAAGDDGGASGPDVAALVDQAHSILLERVRLARAGPEGEFERRGEFRPTKSHEEALPVRSAGAIFGASSAVRLAAFADAGEGERVALLGLPSVEAALAIAEDVGSRGSLFVADARAELLRALEAAAAREGVEHIETRELDAMRLDLRTARAQLALHVPDRASDAEERRAAASALAALLAPGGVAVLVLEGASVPAAPAARREMLRGWWEAGEGAGFERGRTWRWPRGESFVLELRRHPDGREK